MNYTLNLPPEHVQYIVQCLENGVFRLSAPVLSAVMAQVQQQDRDRQAQADEEAQIAASEQRWAEVGQRVGQKGVAA